MGNEFFTAIKNGSSIEDLLMGRIYDPNSKDEFGDTALTCAVKAQRVRTVRALFDVKTVSNLQNDDGTIPLMWAAINPMKRLKGAKDAGWWDNSEDGNVGIILMLLRKGAEPNTPDLLGNTALMWTARNGNYEAFEILINQKKVDKSLKNDKGETALDIAKTNFEEWWEKREQASDEDSKNEASKKLADYGRIISFLKASKNP